MPVLEPYLWIVIVGGISAFAMAFGIGSNDVANAFASSVGAKALTYRQAVVVGAVMEFLGAVLVGSRVTDTVRKGIVDAETFADNPELLMIGMLCALIGAAIWLQICTHFGLPVSTTHSIIGGIIGFALSAHGDEGLDWLQVGLIIVSWVASPVLSGIFAVILFGGTRHWVLRREDAVRRGLIFFPILLFITLLVNAFFVIYKGTPSLGLKNTPVDVAIGSSFGVAIGLTAIIYGATYRYLKRAVDAVPEGLHTVHGEETAKQLDSEVSEVSLEEGTTEDDESPASVQMAPVKAKAKKADDDSEEDDDDSEEDLPRKSLDAVSSSDEETDSADERAITRGIKKLVDRDVHHVIDEDDRIKSIHDNAEKFSAKTEKLFSFLQVFTAVLDSFAHGANDVANSIGPFAAIVSIYQSGEAAEDSEVPIWILVIGGLGIVFGLATLGYKVMQAIGVSLTRITPSRGFAIELGAAAVVVGASRLSIPVSTTHCQVGATVGVGMLEKDKRNAVNWRLFGKVTAGWVATLIFAGLCSATLFSFAAYSPAVNCRVPL